MEAKKHKNRNPQANSATSLSTLWPRYKKLLISYWWIVLSVVIIALGADLAFTRHLPPSFVSSGQMIVNVKLSIPAENNYSEELENFYGTQVALMQSAMVIDRVNQRLESANPDWHRQRVKIGVGMVPKTSIFALKAVGGDPVYIQAYLEATMEEYIILKRELLANASAAAKTNLTEELAQLGVKLERSKQDYLNFQSANSMILLQEDGGNGAAMHLADLSRQLASCQSELHLSESLTPDENLENLPDSGTFPAASPTGATPTAPVAPATTTTPAAAAGTPVSPTTTTPPATFVIPGELASASPSPESQDGLEVTYMQAKQQLLLLKQKRDNLSKLAPAAFELTGMNEEIANQEKLLQFYQEQRQEQLKTRKHSLEVRIEYLKDQIKEWEAKALDASKVISVYGTLKERHQQLQGMYNQTLASLQALEVDTGVGQEGVSILEPASPGVIEPPKTLQYAAIAGILGLMLGIGILVIMDQMNDRPASPLELEAKFDEPLLAQFPLVKAVNRKAVRSVLQPEDDRHTLVEAYQNMRSALIYQDTVANHPRKIAVASANAQDGKSTVAANFAITLAQSGSRVLLVDADLRRGKLHEQFAVPSEPGLAEVLAQRCDWKDAVVATAIPNLFLLPSGVRPPRPGNLFARHTTKFLADIDGHYDYYLFDTTPVMAADDVSSLAPHLDGVIMVIRAGFTSSRMAKSALDSLRMRKVKVIGLAFNGVESGSGGYQYYQDKNYYARPAAS